MDFNAALGNQVYHFSRINPTSYFVSAGEQSLIVYKGRRWQCADDIPESLVRRIGEIIDQHEVEGPRS